MFKHGLTNTILLCFYGTGFTVRCPVVPFWKYWLSETCQGDDKLNYKIKINYNTKEKSPGDFWNEKGLSSCIQ